MKNSTAIAAVTVAVSVLAMACTGNVVDDGSGNSGTTGGSATDQPGAGGGANPGAGTGATAGGNGSVPAGGSAGGAVQPSGPYVPPGSRLRRLTSFEYKNSVIDLLGSGTQVTTEFDRDDAQNNLTAVAASTIPLSATVTEQFEGSANLLAESLVKDTTRRAKVVTCTPSGAADEACLRTFVTGFGRRAFRRPLEQVEVDAYVAVGKSAATTLSDFWGGVQYALSGLLQSPNFLYRTELGVTGSDATRRELTAYEVASRLSYLVWASTPDDQLLDAAADGTLATSDGLSKQFERLLAAPRAQDSLLRAFGEMLRLTDLETMVQSADAFPAAASATLAKSFQTETQNVLKDIIFTRKADYREFFTSAQTSLNSELAKLYGVVGPTGTQFMPVTLPANGPRAGYLGQGSFLALNQKPEGTSPTHRGKFIIETVMCDSIPAPPEGVVTELPAASKSKTLREQLTVHMADPSCKSCHSAMDPMGLALEHFDAIGAYRENDRGMTLDVTGTVNGVSFNGARELGQALTSNVKRQDGNLEVTDCLVRNLFRVATGHLEALGEESLVSTLSSAFTADGFKVQTVLGKLVASEGFRFVGQPE